MATWKKSTDGHDGNHQANHVPVVWPMAAWYNEIDPFAAQWLRELIKADHIADGEVDERSIEDVVASDLKGFTQCHFFAGIGVWSYALRAAGWPDHTPVWTGSCPCQGFSAAGKRQGFSDKRHLWGAWFRLIRELRPEHVFGEQVAGKDGLAWFDVVSSDLEGEGYAVGAADTCAAGFGAPHIRQRLYFVANSRRERLQPDRPDLAGTPGEGTGEAWQQRIRDDDSTSGGSGELAHSRLQPAWSICQAGEGAGATVKRTQHKSGGPSSSVGELVKSQSEQVGISRRTRESRSTIWTDCDWLPCRDGKFRPAQPGIFPLAHGAPARVGRLRGYGNAIVAPQAQAFVEAYLKEKIDPGRG